MGLSPPAPDGGIPSFQAHVCNKCLINMNWRKHFLTVGYPVSDCQKHLPKLTTMLICLTDQT